MKNNNVVRVDTKGRVLIPYHIRELHNIDDGSEFVIVSTHRGEVRLMPLVKGKCANIKIIHIDNPSSLAKITAIMAKNNISIIMSQTKAMERGYTAEWNAIIDISQCKSVKKFYSQISRMDVVRDVDVEEEM